jgi:hypothetical protein
MFFFFRLSFLTLFSAALFAQQPNVSEIIQRSVAANQADFEAAPDFNYKETNRSGRESRTYQVTMIEGSPYRRLIAINGEPLSTSQQQREMQKQQREIEKRRSESPSDRQKRIADYEKERKRDHEMMQQLTKAFNFTYVGQENVRGFQVWSLKAKPRPGYHPPNIETEVLPGMQGQLWIDQKSYQWVKVTAQVVRPVSIVGFLARVEPGTRFELEMSPVEGDIWQISHFSMQSKAKVLGLFNHASQEDSSYFDYQRVQKTATK